MAVGQAKITFEADSSKVSAKLTEAMQAAVAKIESIIGGVSEVMGREGAEAGNALGDGIEAGARKADQALDAIGGDSLDRVSQKAAKAGQEVAQNITSGAQRAEQSLGMIDGRSLNTLSVSAANAGSGLASSITSGAAAANRALGTVSGSSLNSVSAAAANAGSAIASSITNGSAAASRSVSGISSAMSRVSQAASSAGSKIRDSLKKPLDESKESADLIPEAFTRIAGAIAVTAGPMAALKGGFDRLMSIQRAEIMFKSVGLSAEQTKNQMAKLTEQVTGTSVSLADAAKYSAMFAQSGVQLGPQMDSAIQAFTALSSIAEGSGVDVGRVMQQISAQGKVTGEDMMQMADAGVNATKYLADSMGMSQAEVKEAISEGRISFDDFVKAVNQGTGSLAKDMGQTLPAKLANFRTALSSLGAAVIAPFIPGITAAVEFGTAVLKWAVKPINELFTWLNSGSTAANLFKAALIGVTSALAVGAIIGAVGQLAKMVNVVTTLQKVWSALNLGFIATPVGAVIAGVVALVAAIVLLWQNSETFRNFWINAWNSMKSAAEPLIQVISNVWNLLKDAASALASAAWEAFRAVLESVWGVLKSVGEAVWSVVQALAPVLVPVLKVLGAIIGGHVLMTIFLLVGALKVLEVIFRAVGAVVTWFSNAVLQPLVSVLGTVVSWIAEKLSAALSAAVDFISSLVSGVVDWFAGLGSALSGVWESIKTGWDGVWQWLGEAWAVYGQPVVDVIKNVFLVFVGAVILAWDWLKNKFSEVWQWLGETWAAYGQPILDIIKTAWDWFFNLLRTGWDNLILVFQTVWQWLQIGWQTFGQPVLDFIVMAFQTFVAFLGAVWDGIKSAWNAVWSFVKSIYDTVIQPVIDWIQQKFAALSQWVSSKMQAVSSAVQAAGAVIRGLYDQYVAPMVNRVREGFNRAVQVVRGFGSKVKGAVSDAGSWLLNAGRQVVQGMINGISGMVGRLISTVRGFASKAIAAAKSALHIHSPSKDFITIGSDVGKGMVVGIEKMTPAVAEAAAGMSDIVDQHPTMTVQADVVAAPAAVAMPALAAPAMPTLVAPSLPPAFMSQAPAALNQTAVAMQSTVDGVITPMMAGLSAGVTSYSATVTQQTNGVALPAFQRMAAGMVATQSSVIDPTMLAAGQSTTNMAAVMWNQVNGPIKQALAYLVQLLFWAYQSGFQTIFSAVGNSMTWLVNMFNWGVNAIGNAWARIRELTAAPVRFTIGTVFNNGLVGMWNSVADLLGTSKMSPYPLRFATGGLVSGPGGPKDDKIPALLSDGEFVMNADAVKAVGVQNLAALNSGRIAVADKAYKSDLPLLMATDATFNAMASRYAGGGIVEGSPAWKQLKRGWDWARMLSGRPYVLGGDPVNGGGTDCSGYQSSIADRIQGGPGHRRWATMAFNGGGNTQYATGPQGFVKGLAAGFSIGVTNGGAAGGHTAGTIGGVVGMPATNVESGGSPSRVKFGAGAVGADHRQFRTHYHLPIIDGLFVSGGGGSGVSLEEMTTRAMNPFRVKLDSAVKSYGARAGLISQLPGAVKTKLVAAVEARVQKLLAESMADPGGSGAERWRPMAKRAMARVGFDANNPAQVNAMIAQIASESGGNPGVAQQIHDINGTGESAGVGLLQIIPGTFAAYRDPALPNDRRNPFANMVAALRYYKARYGMDLTRMWGHGHGYAHGGLMGEGQGLFHKTAIKPERVLSPRQTTAFEKLVDWLDGGLRLPNIQPAGAAAGTGGAYGEPRNTKQVIVTQNILAADSREVADEVENRLMALL